MLNDSSWICVEADGTLRRDGATPSLLLAGSFNPLHRGHLELASLAARLRNLPIAFELSLANVDKPDLSEDEIHRRIEQFRGSHPVYVTRSPTFREKAALFPNCTFVLGADTAIRLLEPRYYGGVDEMRSALEAIRRHGARFLVGGRVEHSGRFLALDGIPIPEESRDLFAGLAEREFRVDVSSTALRERSARR